MGLGWFDFLKLVFASSLVSALVNLVYNYAKDLGSQKRDKKHVALTVALVLKRFARDADACRQNARDSIEESVRTISYDPVGNIALPQFEFLGEIEWKWLDQGVAARLRNFPQGIVTIRRSIRATWEYADAVAAASEVELQSAKLGKRALELALGSKPLSCRQHNRRRKHGNI